MPTYTYRCQKCGEEFERIQSMSDEPVKRCPTCKGKVQRVFHPVGIVLKGSGFHKTDYRPKRPSDGEKSSSDKPSDKSAEKSSGEKSGGEKSSGKAEKSESKSSESKSSETKPSSGSEGD